MQNAPDKTVDNSQTAPNSVVSAAPSQQFVQYPYRWIIMIISAGCLLTNGLANNAIGPIASKLTKVYQLSDAVATLPINMGFLVYSLANFPANEYMDRNGLRKGFILGSVLIAVGQFCYTLVNRSYFFAILASIIISVGQPFIVNSPAKVATFWFLSQNRPFATAIMTVFNLVGTGAGYVLPTLVVNSEDSNTSESEVFRLYLCECLAGMACCAAVIAFMRSQPKTAPSLGAQQEKLPLKQSFKIIMKSKDLRRFFIAYMLIYGNMVAFGSLANLIMKPYGLTDTSIAVLAILLLLSGVVGSITVGYFLKKTAKYRSTLRLTCLMTLSGMCALAMAFNLDLPFWIIVICTMFLGFSFMPMVPICYDLGCELAFPIGEAQITGILNGSAMIFTFVESLFIGSIVGYGTIKQSIFVMGLLITAICIGSVLLFSIKVELKRRNHERQSKTERNSPEIEMATDNKKAALIEAVNTSGKPIINEYNEFVDEVVL